MDQNSHAPQIVPAKTEAMGIDITPVAYCDPGLFPDGLQVLVMVPGKIKPLGGSAIPPGHVLCLVPPPMAQKIVEMVRHALQQQPGPGQVKAPGIRG
jgi:hypothetical protein